MDSPARIIEIRCIRSDKKDKVSGVVCGNRYSIVSDDCNVIQVDGIDLKSLPADIFKRVRYVPCYAEAVTGVFWKLSPQTLEGYVWNENSSITSIEFKNNFQANIYAR